MDVLNLIFVLAAAGVFCWLLGQAEFITPFFKSCIYAVVGLAALYFAFKILAPLVTG